MVTAACTRMLLSPGNENTKGTTSSSPAAIQTMDATASSSAERAIILLGEGHRRFKTIARSIDHPPRAPNRAPVRSQASCASWPRVWTGGMCSLCALSTLRFPVSPNIFEHGHRICGSARPVGRYDRPHNRLPTTSGDRNTPPQRGCAWHPSSAAGYEGGTAPQHRRRRRRSPATSIAATKLPRRFRCRQRPRTVSLYFEVVQR